MYGHSKELNTNKDRLRKLLKSHSKVNIPERKEKCMPEAKVIFKRHQEEATTEKHELEILPETHLEAKQRDLQYVSEIKCKLDGDNEANNMSFTEFIKEQGWGSISKDFLNGLEKHKRPAVHDSSRMNKDKLQITKMDFKPIDWYESAESKCKHKIQSDVDNEYVAKQRAKWSNFFALQKKTPVELHLEELRKQKQKTEPVKKAIEQSRRKPARGKFPPRRSLSALYRAPRQTHRMRKAMESIADELAELRVQAEQSGECSDADNWSGKCSCSQCDLSQAKGVYAEYID